VPMTSVTRDRHSCSLLLLGVPADHATRSVRFTTGAIRVETDRQYVTPPRLGMIHTLEPTC
jgi:hypothetical protein